MSQSPGFNNYKLLLTCQHIQHTPDARSPQLGQWHATLHQLSRAVAATQQLSCSEACLECAACRQALLTEGCSTGLACFWVLLYINTQQPPGRLTYGCNRTA